MFFRLISAAETFHNALRENLMDNSRFINSSDDILIHGKNQQKHDEILENVA